MLMIRRNPSLNRLNDVHRFRDEMSHLIESFGQRLPGLAATFPATNAWQDDANVHVEAELPGMELSDLEIYVMGGNQLMIKGERKAPQVDKAIWHRQERGFGAFTRVLELPIDVDADQVQARLVNGVLSVKLPKSAAAKPKKIPIIAE